MQALTIFEEVAYIADEELLAIEGIDEAMVKVCKKLHPVTANPGIVR